MHATAGYRQVGFQQAGLNAKCATKNAVTVTHNTTVEMTPDITATGSTKTFETQLQTTHCKYGSSDKFHIR